MFYTKDYNELTQNFGNAKWSIEESNFNEGRNSEESLEMKQNRWFGETLEKMEKVSEKIDGYLREAIVMALDIWMKNPEMRADIDKFSKQWKNRWNVTSEQIYNALRNIEELLRKYWSDREKKLAIEYMQCLQELQKLRKIYDKMIPEIITNLDKQLFSSIEKVVASLDVFTKWANSEITHISPSWPQTWSPFKLYDPYS